MDTAARERGVSEPRDQRPDDEVVPNYVPPAGIGIDDFPNREPRWGFSDYLMLALSVLGFVSLVAFCAPAAKAEHTLTQEHDT
jgi:hypothetical protein